MSDLQLFFAAGLPTITVLIGILLSQRSTDKLEKRIDGFEQRTERKFDQIDVRFNRVESRLDRIEADLREFYRTIGQHEVRMDTLEKRGAWKRRSTIMATLDGSQRSGVARIPGKISGAWVFRGTRLPVATVIENLGDLSVAEVIEKFDVSREQIAVVLNFVAQSLNASVLEHFSAPFDILYSR